MGRRTTLGSTRILEAASGTVLRAPKAVRNLVKLLRLFIVQQNEKTMLLDHAMSMLVDHA